MLLGTWVNEVRLQPGIQWELSDGDTLTFGGQSAPGSPEFYFLFQKVKVRPLDFDAITIPKVIFVITKDRFGAVSVQPHRFIIMLYVLQQTQIKSIDYTLLSPVCVSHQVKQVWAFSAV